MGAAPECKSLHALRNPQTGQIGKAVAHSLHSNTGDGRDGNIRLNWHNIVKMTQQVVEPGAAGYKTDQLRRAIQTSDYSGHLGFCLIQCLMTLPNTIKPSSHIPNKRMEEHCRHHHRHNDLGQHEASLTIRPAWNWCKWEGPSSLLPFTRAEVSLLSPACGAQPMKVRVGYAINLSKMKLDGGGRGFVAKCFFKARGGLIVARTTAGLLFFSVPCRNGPGPPST